uniref:Putative aryl-alcohol dehydrogenase n=1 Tax=Moniliophthora roreri TaxID=221103 RepID=A0A0W0F2T6_MONRR
MAESKQPRKMQYMRLGKSGLKISRIVLGCMSYGTPDWQSWVLEEEEGMKHIKAAYDTGINAFDTANAYSNGQSEVILGKAIKKYNLNRDKIVVMTKVFAAVGDSSDIYTLPKTSKELDDLGYINRHGLSRKASSPEGIVFSTCQSELSFQHIFESVKHSLERLQLDYIDLLQCHRFDDDTPIEETIQALHDVVKVGYVRYIGMSSCYAWQFHAMQNYAIQNGLTPFISMQNHYNLVYREEEREMFPTLKASTLLDCHYPVVLRLVKQYFGVGSIPWSPLARGKLARPLAQQTKRAGNDFAFEWYNNDSTNEIVNRVEELASKRGVGVSAPIVGTTSLENLYELIAAIDIKLSEEEMKYLEEPYKAQALMH